MELDRKRANLEENQQQENCSFGIIKRQAFHDVSLCLPLFFFRCFGPLSVRFLPFAAIVGKMFKAFRMRKREVQRTKQNCLKYDNGLESLWHRSDIALASHNINRQSINDLWTISFTMRMSPSGVWFICKKVQRNVSFCRGFSFAIADSTAPVSAGWNGEWEHRR